MPRAKSPKPYKGILLEQAPVREPDEQLKEFAERWLADLGKKLEALCEHHDVAWDDGAKWERLALQLAFTHVPGMRGFSTATAPKRRGWPSRRQGAKDAEDILLFVELLKAEQSGKSVNNAARLLTKRAGSPFEGKNSEGLRQRYYLLKRQDTDEGRKLRTAVALQVKQVKGK